MCLMKECFFLFHIQYIYVYRFYLYYYIYTFFHYADFRNKIDQEYEELLKKKQKDEKDYR